MANIELKNIEKSFGKNKVINKFNIKINDGEFIVLVGPSGCGKSTLLRMISGLESIDKGEIHLDNKIINNLIPSKRGIAMVFQSYALYPHMNVYENMSFGLKTEKLEKNEIDKKVKDAAKSLQIEDLLERKPRQLSGGQRQRVAIGRAITRNPKLFLFDEPLSNLDAALRSEMRVEISKLHKQLNTNMIYVTHDQIEAMTLADKIVILNNGNVEQVGTPDEIYNNPNNIFVAEFIGVPKMNILRNGIESLLKNLNLKPETYLGIRPEHIHTNGNGEVKLDVKVDLIENLGFEKIIYATYKGQELRIKTSDNISQNLKQISFSKNKIFLFDNNKKRYRI